MAAWNNKTKKKFGEKSLLSAFVQAAQCHSSGKYYIRSNELKPERDVDVVAPVPFVYDANKGK